MRDREVDLVRGVQAVWLAALVTAVALYGCATAPKPAPVARVVCLPLRDYTPDEQKRAAAELETLPHDSALGEMLIDYAAMRAADRACREGR